MNYYIGIDIGGTDIKFGIVNELGEVIQSSKKTTEIEKGIESLIENVIHIVGMLLSEDYEISGIGVSTAGVVDTENGEILYAGETMPGYTGTNWKIVLEGKYGISVMVHNDVNAVALGEGWVGAAKGADTYFCMTLGTGIGGAIVINQKLYKGKNYRAAEIGYMGKRRENDSIYEKTAATSILVQAARILYNSNQVEGEQIFLKAKMQDENSIQLLDRWTEKVVIGLVDIICLLDPGLIIIGGGVSSQGDFLIQQIEKKLSLFLPEAFQNLTTIKTAENGNHAGIVGAVSEFNKK
jgi:glucokinase